MSRIDSHLPRIPPPARGGDEAKGKGAGEAPEGKGSGTGEVQRGDPNWQADPLAPVAPTTEAPGTTRAPEETKAPERENPKDGYQGKEASKDATEQGKKLGGRELRAPTPEMGRLKPQLERLFGQDMEQLAKRFGSDLGLMRPEVMPKELSNKEQAARLWQFFGAYAEAAVEGGASEKGLEAFRKALENAGFHRFTDGRSGENGLKSAMWTLAAQTPEDVRGRLDQVELEGLPEEQLPEGFLSAKRDVKAEQAQLRNQEGHLQAQQEAAQQHKGAEQAPHDRPQDALLQRMPGQDALRVNMMAAQAAAAGLAKEGAQDGVQQGSDRQGERRGVLGNNMLFNALHTLRGEGKDAAVEKEKFDRAAFGIVLAFVGITLAAIALIVAT